MTVDGAVVDGWALMGSGKKAWRDSSAAQADSFAGAKEEEKRRLAALGMTVMRFGVMTVRCSR
jgi:hypothetical protein